MHSSVKKMITIFDIPDDMAKKVVEVLQNDLKEYESLDRDFGPGTEDSLKKMIAVIEPYLTDEQRQDESPQNNPSE